MKLTLALLGLLSISGCDQQAAPGTTPGPIDPAYYGRAQRDEKIRLEGEDKAPFIPPDLGPPLLVPFNATGFAINVVFVQPTQRIVRIFTGDNPRNAARDALNTDSPDARRWGIFRLADEKYFRQGVEERKLMALKAHTDPDYTVRAAAIRVLNRDRAPGNTPLFLAALKDDAALVRLEATKALANLPDPVAVSFLIDTMQHDDNLDVRIAAADALRCYRSDEAAQALVGVLNDEDFSVAWQARQSLMLMTAHDYLYDERAWLNYLANTAKPFAPLPG